MIFSFENLKQCNNVNMPHLYEDQLANRKSMQLLSRNLLWVMSIKKWDWMIFIFFFNNDDRGNKTSGILFDIYVQHNI